MPFCRRQHPQSPSATAPSRGPEQAPRPQPAAGASLEGGGAQRRRVLSPLRRSPPQATPPVAFGDSPLEGGRSKLRDRSPPQAPPWREVARSAGGCGPPGGRPLPGCCVKTRSQTDEADPEVRHSRMHGGFPRHIAPPPSRGGFAYGFFSKRHFQVHGAASGAGAP